MTAERVILRLDFKERKMYLQVCCIPVGMCGLRVDESKI